MTQRKADILGPSPYSGELPEGKEMRHPVKEDDWNPAQDLRIVYIKGQIHISPHETYEELAKNAGAGDDYVGPMAVGRIHIDMGKASFEVSTNIHAKGIERVLQSLCAKEGWQWGGITDLQGQPLSEPHVSSIYFQEEKGRLNFAYSSEALRSAQGAIHVNGRNAHVYPMRRQWYPALKEWADDEKMQLISGMDNVIKVIEDIEQEDLYSPEWNNPEDHYMGRDPLQNDTAPAGPFKCKNCDRDDFPTFNALLEHQKNDEQNGWHDIKEDSGMQSPPDMDDVVPWKFHEKGDLVYGSIPKPMLSGPVPFIYDIKDDKIEVGNPMQTPDDHAADRFTPGGIVRGTYDPKGQKLTIQSLSDYSVTIGHILDLWAWQPETSPLYIKSVWLDDGTGPEQLQ